MKNEAEKLNNQQGNGVLPCVSGSFKQPHDWFCEKYGIDILEERLILREHTGNNVIYFIEEYLKDHCGTLNYR